MLRDILRIRSSYGISSEMILPASNRFVVFQLPRSSNFCLYPVADTEAGKKLSGQEKGGKD